MACERTLDGKTAVVRVGEGESLGFVENVLCLVEVDVAVDATLTTLREWR